MKRKILIRSYFLVFVILLSFSCLDQTKRVTLHIGPLPSWNEGKCKNSIIQFVENAINKESPDFVPKAERIAVFDNDGTLWSEKPLYFQLYYALSKITEQTEKHPEWKTEQPFKAVIEDDKKTLAKFGDAEFLKILIATHSELTTSAFDSSVKKWISTAKHPLLDRPFTDLVYQPMLELIKYLQQNDFKTFIVSDGGIDFIRSWTEEVYNIPKEQIIGSTLKTEYSEEIGEKPGIKKISEIEFINNKEEKPIEIQKFIGKKPVFCAGNSDGDLAMMEYTASNPQGFMLYVHHTDSIREWSYDRKSPIGTLDKGLDEAKDKGWSVIDMKKDWKVIYPFELK